MRMGRGKRAVTAVCFSNDESKVAAVGLDDDHTVTVFNAQSGAAMCSDKTGPDKVLDVAWSQSGNTFCTVGIKHVCFWECAGGALTKKKGLFGKAGPMCNMTSVAFLSNGKAVSGGTNGMVYLWEDRNCVKAVDVHGRGNAVHTIKVEGNRIFSGGKDNNVIELDQDLNKVGNPKAIGSCPRAIDFKDNNLLVGSRDGKI